MDELSESNCSAVGEYSLCSRHHSLHDIGFFLGGGVGKTEDHFSLSEGWNLVRNYEG